MTSFIKKLRKSGINPQAFKSEYEKLFQKQYCSYGETTGQPCSGGFIKAHSVSRANSLEKIAESGHVLTFMREPFSHTASGKHPAPKHLGVSKASTFTGFCSIHDSSLFRPVDNLNTSISKELLGLMGYRAICRELYFKRAGSQTPDLLRQLLPDAEHYIGDYLEELDASYELGARDLVAAKRDFENAVTASDFTGIQYYALRFSEPLNFVCSGAVTVDIDFWGRVLQTGETPSKAISYTIVNVFPTSTGACLALCWISDPDGVNRRLVKSFDAVRREQLSAAATRFVFEYSENVYTRPSWWETLGSKTREGLLTRMYEGGFQSGRRIRTCLQDDGLEYDCWRDVEILTNCDFL